MNQTAQNLFYRPNTRVALCLLSACLAGGCHQPTRPMPAETSQPSSLKEDTVPEGSRIFHIDADGSDIRLIVLPGKLNVTDAGIQRWIKRSAAAHVHYFGKFPLLKANIRIVAAEEGSIGDGYTTDEQIRVTLGPEARQADLDNDWIMVHEMFHLAFPSMDDRYIWLREGLASYLEPLARARIGTIDVDKVWGDLYEGLPQGQPMAGDQGLDNTHTRERTYWGGSIFCLLMDLRIREQTHNRKSIDDAMRAVLNQGGDRYQEWSMDKVIDVCDRATGTTVMRDLYQEMENKPDTVDLEAMWRRVGVSMRGRRVVYDNSAPLADIRISMTRN